MSAASPLLRIEGLEEFRFHLVPEPFDGNGDTLSLIGESHPHKAPVTWLRLTFNQVKRNETCDSLGGSGGAHSHDCC